MPDTAQTRVLDWRPRFDRRSLNYRIRDLFHTTVTPRQRTWNKTVVLDQGREGACTGFGAAHCLACTPRQVPNITGDLARQLYYEARRNDEWEGEDYEGSSVLGAMKALKARGLITEYRWATTLDEIVHAVALFGPMEIGVNWYADMFTPDYDGLIHPTGGLAGGHALCLGAVHPRTYSFTLYNSWGPGWGRQGRAKITYTAVEQLLREWGEFALPIKVRPKIVQEGAP